MQRSAAQGHHQACELALFETLLPHVRRSAQLSRRLGEAGLMADAGSGAEALPYGLILLDKHGRVQLANRGARRILAAEVLRDGSAGLRAAHPSDDAHLQRLISTRSPPPRDG